MPKTIKIIVVSSCENVAGMSKLNRKRNANSNETAQMHKSTLKIIHDGVVA
jgi:hypothetical protein